MGPGRLRETCPGGGGGWLLLLDRLGLARQLCQVYAFRHLAGPTNSIAATNRRPSAGQSRKEGLFQTAAKPLLRT